MYVPPFDGSNRIISINLREVIAMDFSKVKAGDRITYIADSFAFGGTYTVVTAESTYTEFNTMPDNEIGKLIIIEFMNNGEPMFFPLKMLNPKDWELRKSIMKGSG